MTGSPERFSRRSSATLLALLALVMLVLSPLARAEHERLETVHTAHADSPSDPEPAEPHDAEHCAFCATVAASKHVLSLAAFVLAVSDERAPGFAIPPYLAPLMDEPAVSLAAPRGPPARA